MKTLSLALLSLCLCFAASAQIMTNIPAATNLSGMRLLGLADGGRTRLITPPWTVYGPAQTLLFSNAWAINPIIGWPEIGNDNGSASIYRQEGRVIGSGAFGEWLSIDNNGASFSGAFAGDGAGITNLPIVWNGISNAATGRTAMVVNSGDEVRVRTLKLGNLTLPSIRSVAYSDAATTSGFVFDKPAYTASGVVGMLGNPEMNFGWNFNYETANGHLLHDTNYPAWSWTLGPTICGMQYIPPGTNVFGDPAHDVWQTTGSLPYGLYPSGNHVFGSLPPGNTCVDRGYRFDVVSGSTNGTARFYGRVVVESVLGNVAAANGATSTLLIDGALSSPGATGKGILQISSGSQSQSLGIGGYSADSDESGHLF